MVFRVLEEKDVPPLVAWEKAERPYPWTERHFLETIGSSNTQTLIFENEKGLIGFAVLQIVPPETYLLNMMVARPERRKGLGAEILRSVLSWAKQEGAVEIFLDVDPLNLSAARLYKKMGFEKVSVRKKAYPNGEDAVSMRRIL